MNLHLSAPGRICLFGEHQDYLGLPVIAAAINLRVHLRARPSSAPAFHVTLPDIREERSWPLAAAGRLPYRHERDYLAAGINVAARRGLDWQHGWEVEVHGEIPLNSGASSSSALQVAWCAFLLAAAGERDASPEAAARLAYESEVREFHSPGGMMDHYASALGGTIWLDCANPENVERLTPPPGEFLLVDSGQPKDTNGVLGRVRARVESFPPEMVRSTAAVPDLDAEATHLLHATRENLRLTEAARELLRGGAAPEEIGDLLTAHHRHLSQGLGVSTAEIDAWMEEGLRAGSLGGKINGSGGGGTFYFLCHETDTRTEQAMRAAGRRVWRLRPAEGLRHENAVGSSA